MKKVATIIGIVLLLLVAAAAAAPYWFGMQAQEAHNQLVQEFSKGGGVSLTTQRYDRGWLNSTAETVMTVPGVPATVTATHDIAHGPLAINRLLAGQLDLTPALAFISTRLSMNPSKDAGEMVKIIAPLLHTVATETVIGLDGNADITVSAPGGKRSAKDGTSMSWRGLTGTIQMLQQGQQVITDLQFPALSISSPNGEFVLNQLRLHSDVSGQAGYMFGNNTLQVGSIRVGPDIDITGLRFSTLAKPAGATLNSTVSYQVKDITVGTEHYGPGQLTIAVRKLDAAALRRYEQQVNNISKRSLPAEQASMMLAAETMKLVAALSKKAPELEVTKLSFKSPEGELTGSAKVVLDGSNLDLSQNMMLLVRALQGEAELSIPASMVKAILTPQIRQDVEAFKHTGTLTAQEAAKLTPKVMARIVDQAYPSYIGRNGFTKLLIPAGADYRLTVAFKDGRLLLNNKPLAQPLPGLS